MGETSATKCDSAFEAQRWRDCAGHCGRGRRRRGWQPAYPQTSRAAEPWFQQFLERGRATPCAIVVERGRRCLPGQCAEFRLQDLAAAVRSGSRPQDLGLRRRRVRRRLSLIDPSPCRPREAPACRGRPIWSSSSPDLAHSGLLPSILDTIPSPMA